MHEFAGLNRAKLLELLGERAAYEREAVRLYDVVIRKIDERCTEPVQVIVESLRACRNQERDHERWLNRQIRRLGGDPYRSCDGARLLTIEAEGIERVIDFDGDVSHLFHALLMAELSDHAGWELMLDVATEAGDQEAARAFERRLVDKARHLLLLKRAIQHLISDELLGRGASHLSSS